MKNKPCFPLSIYTSHKVIPFFYREDISQYTDSMFLRNSITTSPIKKILRNGHGEKIMTYSREIMLRVTVDGSKDYGLYKLKSAETARTL